MEIRDRDTNFLSGKWLVTTGVVVTVISVGIILTLVAFDLGFTPTLRVMRWDAVVSWISYHGYMHVGPAMVILGVLKYFSDKLRR